MDEVGFDSCGTTPLSTGGVTDEEEDRNLGNESKRGVQPQWTPSRAWE